MHTTLLTAIIPVGNYSLRKLELWKILEQVQKAPDWLEAVVVFAGPQRRSDYHDFLSEVQKLKTPNFRAIVASSAGPGVGRNEGRLMARSPYVMFWDDDDFPFIEEIKLLLPTSAGQRVLVGQYQMLHQDSLVAIGKSNTVNLYDLAVNPGLWRMIIPTEILSKVSFPRRMIAEDYEFLYDLIRHDVEFEFHGGLLYRYVRKQSGLSSNPSLTDLLEVLNSMTVKLRTNPSKQGPLVLCLISVFITSIKVIVTSQHNQRHFARLLSISASLCRLAVVMRLPLFALVVGKRRLQFRKKC